MSHRIFGFVFIALAMAVTSACHDSAEPNAPVLTPAQEQLLEDVAEAELAAKNAEAPPPVLQLTTPPGWTRSEPRPLPPDDHGFTVAYEHESGLGVTLYQFTRGRTSISDDLNSAPIQQEMRDAKTGIQQAVELGYWQAAREKSNATVALGDSPRQALWSQYELTVEDVTLASDIYVWSHANTFLKLRCTSRAEDAPSNQTILKPLLTAFGTAKQSTDD